MMPRKRVPGRRSFFATTCLSAVASVLTGASFLACRGNDFDPNRNPPTPSDPACPGGGTICALKLGSTRPAVGDAIELVDVVVTTPTISLTKDSTTGAVVLAGFYVQNLPEDSLADRRFSGIAVTYAPNIVAASIPGTGQLVKIVGTYTEAGTEGSEKQAQIRATEVTALGSQVGLEPVSIDAPASIGTSGESADAYEGVFVKVSEVQIELGDKPPASSPCSDRTSATAVMHNGSQICGAFRIDPSLIVSSQMVRYRNPTVGERFTSIAGILRRGVARFEAGAMLLTPRFSGDLVPKNAALVVRTIAGIQDPSSPDRPIESCRNPNGSEVVGKCATAELSGVVVTAAGGYVSSKLRSLFVRDPNDSDGKFGGVKVVYNTAQLNPVPQVGDTVDVKGEIIEYRGGMQIQYPTVTRVSAAQVVPEPITVADVATLFRDNPAAHAYEGTLVRVENVVVTSACVEDEQQRDHGYFVIQDGVLIGSAWRLSYAGDLRPSRIQCLDGDQQPTGLCSCEAASRPNDRRRLGDRFSAIVGVVDYAYGDFMLNPRADSDLKPE